MNNIKVPAKSLKRKKSMEDENDEKSSKNSEPKKSLLHLFIQYVWDDKDGQFTEIQDKRLLSWLKFRNIDFNSKNWYHSTMLDIRASPRIELTDDIKSNSTLWIQTMSLIDERICANLAFTLKNVLPTLIKCEDNVNYENENGQTILHIVADSDIEEKDSCINKHLELIQSLVLKGADINKKNKDGLTAVHLAARKFHIEVLKFFATNNAKFCQYTNKNETPLHLACKSSSRLEDTSKMIETINLLVSQGCAIDAVDDNGFTAMHYAAVHRAFAVIQKLIELGATVDPRSAKTLVSPLHLAIKNNQPDNMKILVQAGADVNAEAANGSTPLLVALIFGTVESMQFLIHHNADVHYRENLTLLHLSVCEQVTGNIMNWVEFKKFRILIDIGLDVNDAGNCGITPLLLAVLSGNFNTVETLIRYGANVNYQSHNTEWTALHLALMRKNLGIANILVKNGADVNCRGGNNQLTPLHLALMSSMTWSLGVYSENIDELNEDISFINKRWPKTGIIIDFMANYEPFVTLLLEHGADVNLIHQGSGRSPLYLATVHQDIKLMRKLLDHGAKVNVEDANGRLPLHNILEHGNKEGFELLLEYGADINDEDISKLIVNREVKQQGIIVASNYHLKIINVHHETFADIVESNMKAIATEHVIKLKLADLPIAKLYETPIDESTFKKLYNQCVEEVKNLATYYVDKVSLYQFLRMNTTGRRLACAEKIINSFKTLKDKFPIYINLIKAACCDSYDRKRLLEEATIAWHQISTFRLPDDCIEHIISFLSNRYLERLIYSASKEAIVEKKRSVFQCSMKSMLGHEKSARHLTFTNTRIENPILSDHQENFPLLRSSRTIATHSNL